MLLHRSVQIKLPLKNLYIPLHTPAAAPENVVGEKSRRGRVARDEVLVVSVSVVRPLFIAGSASIIRVSCGSEMGMA